jgi:hypothetical protein
VFIFAQRQDWIDRNPFHTGEPLINRAAENRRNRVLTYEEEDALLAQCVGNRVHLRPLMIAAIESGMRPCSTIVKQNYELGNTQWQAVLLSPATQGKNEGWTGLATKAHPTRLFHHSDTAMV